MKKYLFTGLIETPNLPPKVNIEEVSYKIFLLGKSGVGKTSLVSKLVGTGTVICLRESFLYLLYQFDNITKYNFS